MPEIFWDVIEFFRAVILQWSNVVTGGAIGLAWLCYQVFTNRPMPFGVSLSILLIGLCMAVFGAWHEQYVKNKRGLAGEILSLVWNEANAPPGKTLLFLQARIVNNGPPTIVDRYELQAILADGTKLTGDSLYVREGVELQAGSEKTRITKIIYEETVSPIPQGGQAAGWVCFELPANRDRIRRNDTSIVFGFRDARARRYTANSPAMGTSKGLKYYPGGGNIPEIRSPSPSPPDPTAPH